MTTFTEKYASVAGSGSQDGSSAANAWTMAQATANVAAGNRVNCLVGTYVADDSSSGSIMDIDVVGTIGNWIEWRAYTTTIGDFTPGEAQPCLIDAGVNSLTHALLGSTPGTNAYNRFIGFEFTGASSHGVNNSVTDAMSFIGCKSHNNGGRGFQSDDRLSLLLCEITNNVTSAINCDNETLIVACKIHGESSNAVDTQQVELHFSLFYDNGNGINLNASSKLSAIGNTFDGDGQAASIALRVVGGSNIPTILLNNIFFDLGTGVDFGNAGVEESRVRGFNYFSSCTTNYDTIADETTDIDDGTTDPFTNSGTRDYTLASGSNAIGAGADAGNFA